MVYHVFPNVGSHVVSKFFSPMAFHVSPRFPNVFPISSPICSQSLLPLFACFVCFPRFPMPLKWLPGFPSSLAMFSQCETCMSQRSVPALAFVGFGQWDSGISKAGMELTCRHCQIPAGSGRLHVGMAVLPQNKDEVNKLDPCRITLFAGRKPGRESQLRRSHAIVTWLYRWRLVGWF